MSAQGAAAPMAGLDKLPTRSVVRG